MSKPPDTSSHSRRDGIEPSPELIRMSVETPLVALDIPGPSRGRHWLATGPEEVRAILGDDRFSMIASVDGGTEGARQIEIGNLLQYDPPEHTRLRKMVAPEFTLRRIRRLESFTEKVTAECLDDLESAGRPADLMRHFAYPVPGLVGCALLGVPRDDLSDLARHFILSRGGSNSAAGQDRAAREKQRQRQQQQRASGNAYLTYMRRFIRDKRRDPGDDLIGMLIREYGADISDEELTGTAATLLDASLENVGGMLGLGPLALLQHPDQLALLLDRPELIDSAVDEIIRYVSLVSNATPRTAQANVRIGDQVIKAGETVICSLLAVNRTQLPGAPQDTLDITRQNPGHMAFGHGIHHCLGASLARMELRIALPALLHRLPGLRLAVPPTEIRYRSGSPNYGLDELLVTW